MSEAEKQESQKTVVAFISGLLIGGLLVWIFSSSPENTQNQNAISETERTESAENTEENAANTSNSSSEVKKPVATAPTQEKVEVGEGSLTISDQKAGNIVEIGTVTFPAEAGWIVVRDDINGNPGNTLGAARYNLKDGLIPKTVELLRGTEAGKKYQVFFYTQEGDLSFKLGEDKQTTIPGITFTAQ